MTLIRGGREAGGLQTKSPVKYWRTQSHRPMGRAGELYWQAIVDGSNNDGRRARPAAVRPITNSEY